jgi:hypothetical protein
MLEALREVGGASAVEHVRFERDPSVERIVGGWPARFTSARAERLGLRADPDFQSVIAQYQRDHAPRAEA